MTLSLSQEKKEKKSPMHRASREVTRMGQGTKKIDRAVIVHSPSSISAILGFTTPANSRKDFQIFSRGTIDSIKTGKGRATLVETKYQPVPWEVVNFTPSSTDNKFRCINPGLGTSFQEKPTGGP